LKQGQIVLYDTAPAGRTLAFAEGLLHGSIPVPEIPRVKKEKRKHAGDGTDLSEKITKRMFLNWRYNRLPYSAAVHWSMNRIPFSRRTTFAKRG